MTTPNTDAPADDQSGTLPTPLDALGRELVAIRQFATALVMMCDAALTNFRICQLGETSKDTVRLDASNVIDRIRAMSTGGGVPKTFGGRGRTDDTDGVSELHDEDPDALRVPPIGGEIGRA